MIPAEQRLPQAEGLVEQLGYFVVHAPRQTGKTTALRGLTARLNATGRHAAVMISCEEGRSAGDDYVAVQRMLVSQLMQQAEATLPSAQCPSMVEAVVEERLLGVFLARWASSCPLPLALVFDEIDSLRGASLLNVLSQLRAGFAERPGRFPASVVLCGLRDVRDYKAASGGDPSRLGTSSPFNIKLKSLRVGDFSEAEVRSLFEQHTTETGQIVDEPAFDRMMEATAGQPWLVNALGNELIEEMSVPLSEPLTAQLVDDARERLILARATHLDSLVARLDEPRVRRIIEPILAGTFLGGDDPYDDDLQYCRDLGLITQANPIAVANSIYREVIVRVLAGRVESQVLAEPRSFVLPDGRLDFPRVLREFAEFWREHGEILTRSQVWHETAPQLVLMAFLQRVVNGGGFIDREYGIGRGRIDLLVRWPYRDEQGRRVVQREALELEVWAKGPRDPLDKGLQQLDGYLQRLGLDSGVLVIFDRRPEAGEAGQMDERTRFEAARTEAGRAVTVLRG